LLALSNSWNKFDCSEINPIIFFLIVSSNNLKYYSTIFLISFLTSLILIILFSNTLFISCMVSSYYLFYNFYRIPPILLMHWFFKVLNEWIYAGVRMFLWCFEWFYTHYGHSGRTHVIAEQKFVYCWPSCS
jgi:hypothetical protein